MHFSLMKLIAIAVEKNSKSEPGCWFACDLKEFLSIKCKFLFFLIVYSIELSNI